MREPSSCALVGVASYRVTQGQLFSFAIGPASPNGRAAVLVGSGPAGNGLPPGNVYTGGTLRVTGNFSSYLPITGDAGFRTFVDIAPAVVPEPSNWLLLIVGFGTIGVALRRRASSRGNIAAVPIG